MGLMNKKGSRMRSKRNLRVVELFAGVGGFRLGLCGTNKKALRGYELVWANQWEPATKMQHAAIVYSERFHGGATKPNDHFNTDINKVVEINPLPLPEHDLLVGGFPCQDYSVARTLSQAAGIEGKKGVLWWAIYKILQKKSPNYVMLENVDRLLKSPAKQRGRDFGIILASLSDLGYSVEWRVINAADYGMPQRRRRIFILGYKDGSPIHRAARKTRPIDWLTQKGIIANAFPVKIDDHRLPIENEIGGNLADITENFKYPFENTGVIINRKFITIKTRPNYSGPKITLADVVLPSKQVPKEYFINKNGLEQWKYLKNAKKEERSSKTGFKYIYTEGPVAFPDPLNKPSRTIVTGEGGPTPSRFKHVIKQDGHYRRLTPVELERLCMFPDNHTAYPMISDVKRAFFMGNALVVGIIDRLGKALLKAHREA